MYKIAEDELIMCPYNRYHIVSKLRIQKHLIKCKKNYPDVKLSTCIYNYTHRLKPEDMLDHYKICPYKARFEEARYYETASCPSDSSVQTDIFSNRSLSRMKQYSFSLKSLPSTITEMECLKENKSVLSPIPSDDELEPLPLPKTTSKAFVSSKSRGFVCNNSLKILSKLNKVSPGAESLASRSIMTEMDCLGDKSDLSPASSDDELEASSLPTTPLKAFESSKPKGFGRSTNFLNEKPQKTIMQELEDDKSEREVISKLSLKSTSCSELSGMFDSCVSLKSEDIIFEDDTLILKNFDKHVKI